VQREDRTISSTTTAAPLRAWTVIVTRAADRADSLQQLLEARGARVVSCALTRTERLPSTDFSDALRSPQRYDWVVFTSATAITTALAMSDESGVTRDVWTQMRVAVVGASSAEAARAAGLMPALQPEQFHAEALVEALGSRGSMRGQRVLYPTARGASDVIAHGLRALGAVVDRIDVYETVAATQDVGVLRGAVHANDACVVTLTAASAVAAWCSLAPDVAARTPVVSIGPVTTAAARAAGLRVVAEAAPSTVAGLVDAVCAAVQHRHAVSLSPSFVS
jgi:uroporphyrinogen III methyltransferase / synthase